MKIELGSGNRGTRGYIHTDLQPFPGIDVVSVPWLLDYPDNSVEEVLALAVIEHLTFGEAYDTFRNIHRMLQPGGAFVFDVPDYPIWCGYYLDLLNGDLCPLPLDHVRRTLFGWQRWPGDEHKSGWDGELLSEALNEAGYTTQQLGVQRFLDRGLYRRRFHRPEDAHLYVVATK